MAWNISNLLSFLEPWDQINRSQQPNNLIILSSSKIILPSW